MVTHGDVARDGSMHAMQEDSALGGWAAAAADSRRAMGDRSERDDGDAEGA
jgi:hypothetical protein